MPIDILKPMQILGQEISSAKTLRMLLTVILKFQKPDTWIVHMYMHINAILLSECLMKCGQM